MNINVTNHIVLLKKKLCFKLTTYKLFCDFLQVHKQRIFHLVCYIVSKQLISTFGKMAMSLALMLETRSMSLNMMIRRIKYVNHFASINLITNVFFLGGRLVDGYERRVYRERHVPSKLHQTDVILTATAIWFYSRNLNILYHLPSRCVIFDWENHVIFLQICSSNILGC